jgi:hypothetical protein
MAAEALPLCGIYACPKPSALYKQIAQIIGSEVGMGPSAEAVDAVAKGVERYLKRLKNDRGD